MTSFVSPIRRSFPHVEVGTPPRSFSDLEIMLAFGAAIRWQVQREALCHIYLPAGETFTENAKTTANIAAIYCLMQGSQSGAFVNAVRRSRPDFNPQLEIRCTLGVDQSNNLVNYFTNAVVALTGRIVEEMLRGPSSVIGAFYIENQRASVTQSFRRCTQQELNFDLAALDAFLGPTLQLQSELKEMSFHEGSWNEIVDSSQKVQVMVHYVVDRPSSKMKAFFSSLRR